MEFVKWRSIPRLSKERMTLTEKIDGSNAAIRIREWTIEDSVSGVLDTVEVDGILYNIWVQSRTRFISPENDNFGFAQWVWTNRVELIRILGVGEHYGEWWGSKIQRGYGLKGERRFSLFNAPRWVEFIKSEPGSTAVEGLCTVPLLYAGPFSGEKITEFRELLRLGSRAVDHQFDAEGLVVDLREAGARYKVLLENDDLHKWEVPVDK